MFAVALFFWGQLAHAGESIVVLLSDDLPAYDVPVAQYQQALANHDIEVFNLLGDKQRALRMAAQINADPPPLLFALGPKAAWIAQHELPDVPMIYAMVFEPSRYGIPPEHPGVSMSAPPELVLAQMDLMFPDFRRIGILLDEGSTPDWLPEIQVAIERAGYELHLQTLPQQARVRRTISEIREHVDVLWLLPEPRLLTPGVYHALYTEAVRTNLPILGYSETLVRAGALMCLAPDYEDVGRLAAQLSDDMLTGTLSEDAPVVRPEGFRVLLNMDTLDTLGLSIDPILLDFVDEVVTDPSRR